MLPHCRLLSFVVVCCALLSSRVCVITPFTALGNARERHPFLPSPTILSHMNILTKVSFSRMLLTYWLPSTPRTSVSDPIVATFRGSRRLASEHRCADMCGLNWSRSRDAPRSQ